LKKIFILTLVFALFISNFLPAAGESVEESAVRSVVEKYYNALKGHNYESAYNLLEKNSRDYFGSLANYKSTFEVTGLSVIDYKIYKIDITDVAVSKTVVTYEVSGVLFDEPVQESKSYKDILIKENGNWRLQANMGPYKSLAVQKSAEEKGLQVVIYAIDFYPEAVQVNLSFSNTGKGSINVLPYNEKTSISYGDGIKIPTAELPYSVDGNLYSGVMLEPGMRVVGFVNFDARIAVITKETIANLEAKKIDTAKLKSLMNKEIPKEKLRDNLFDMGYNKEDVQKILDNCYYKVFATKNIKNMNITLGGNVKMDADPNIDDSPFFEIKINDIKVP